ncbi:unnamed protein product [Cuscuta europaea]|uniref:Retrovirus-related Pol polyprotein from transposon TNT 1-94-like beta-barrel domain-containing protein n=1 Tax=Cuscuta europaea TaxID=41803 RepID=A0A9P0Z1S6_CUSEU|nr:unnamed protein product [Cuscuta europaea]
MLTKEQVEVLLNMINSETCSCNRMTGMSPYYDCIIDTGATHHVTGDLSRLMNLIRINGCPFGLPDGRIVTATMEGSVCLSPTLSLEHVLYVPVLHCHLISVAKLIDQMACTVSFTNSLCAIQDLHPRNLIGSGERRDGLFYFRGVPTVHAIIERELMNFELWRRRLGNPSDRVVKLVPGVSSSVFCKKLNKARAVCPQAKQVRDSFPISHKYSGQFPNRFTIDLIRSRVEVIASCPTMHD